MISIIIPAHNEANVISSCLTGLLPGIESGEFEVIVVCNGCADRTADTARLVSSSIEVIEVEKPSKTNALNVGDHAAHHFPRLYLDADICISHEDVLVMARKLDEGKLLAVSPCMQMDMAESSWAVRAFYDVWSQLPYCKAGLIGVGAYALSENGRSRFESFPEILADDGFIRLLYSAEERAAVPGVFSIVKAPSNLLNLIKIKTRSRLGGYELRNKFPELFENDNKDYSSALTDTLASWRLWPKVAVYVLVNVFTRLRARGFAKRNVFTVWERDESSRN